MGKKFNEAQLKIKQIETDMKTCDIMSDKYRNQKEILNEQRKMLIKEWYGVNEGEIITANTIINIVRCIDKQKK